MRISITGLILAAIFGGNLASAQFIDRTNSNVEGDRANARRAAVSAAQGEVDRAQASLDAVTARINANLKANPEVLAADKELATKQAVYDKARQPIIDRLEKDPEYQLAKKQAKTADSAVKAEQSASSEPSPTTAPAPPTDMQVQAATEKLEQKSAMRDMEEKALAADPAASQARVELDAAREKVKAIRLQFDAAKRNDPEFKSALDGLNAAKSRLTAASGQN